MIGEMAKKRKPSAGTRSMGIDEGDDVPESSTETFFTKMEQTGKEEKLIFQQRDFAAAEALLVEATKNIRDTDQYDWAYQTYLLA